MTSNECHRVALVVHIVDSFVSNLSQTVRPSGLRKIQPQLRSDRHHSCSSNYIDKALLNKQLNFCCSYSLLACDAVHILWRTVRPSCLRKIQPQLRSDSHHSRSSNYTEKALLNKQLNFCCSYGLLACDAVHILWWTGVS
jgi:hypothetical protein